MWIGGESCVQVKCTNRGEEREREREKGNKREESDGGVGLWRE